MRRSAIGAATALALWLVATASGAEPRGWDKVINKPNRFKVLKKFEKQAVLDKETGLVWVRQIATQEGSWRSLAESCARRTVANRRGFRLPHLAELMSLIDPSQSNPALPSGHPFELSGDHPAYTATRYDSTDIYGVSLGDGDIQHLNPTGPLTVGAWCVRGGMGANVDH